MREIGLLVLGLGSGVFSGLVGVGGGVVIVPALVLLFGLSQHQAQGTTLALLVPPIGILAAWTYYKQGYVDLEQTERFGDVEVVWTGLDTEDLGELPIDDYEG